MHKYRALMAISRGHENFSFLFLFICSKKKKICITVASKNFTSVSIVHIITYCQHVRLQLRKLVSFKIVLIYFIANYYGIRVIFFFSHQNWKILIFRNIVFKEINFIVVDFYYCLLVFVVLNF